MSAGAAIAAQWRDGALRDGGLGLLAGVAIGTISLWLTRFERGADGFHYTPIRWLVMALTIAIAARLVLGLVATWNATLGAVGVKIASTVAKASRKSSAMRVRTSCAFR